MLNQINYGTPITGSANEVFESQTRFTSSPNVTLNGCENLDIQMEMLFTHKVEILQS